MQPPPPPSKLQSRYQFHSVVGQGGAGEVSTAWDTQLERTVAIKRLKPDGVSENVVHSTWQEAMRLASIRHANIVTVYDMGMDEGAPYIVMEYVNGETIDERIERQGPMDTPDFLALAEQTLEGLTAAHHAGLLHRDLKPSNVMLSAAPTGQFQVKLLDFGISRFLSAPNSEPDKDGTVTGSVFCVAPEILNREPVDTRSDLYSIGCVFYFALAGVYPFDGDRISDVIAAHLNHEALNLHSRRPDLPQALCEWVMVMINRWPQNRYSSSMQALAALQDIAEFRAEAPTSRIRVGARPGGAETTAADVPVAGAKQPEKSLADATGRKMPWAAVAGIAAVLALAAFFGGKFLGGNSAPHDSASGETKAAHAPAPVRVVSLNGGATPAPANTREPTIPASTDAAAPPPAPAAAVAASPTPGAAALATTKTDTAPHELAPAPPAEVVLRFHGSNTIGAELLPALLERFLEKQGAIETRRIPGKDHEEMTIEGRFAEGVAPKAIEIAAHGSKTAFDDLVAQKCDVGVASRPIKPEEAQACAAIGLGDLQSAACEHVLGLDGIAVLVHKGNPVDTLSVQQIGDIFSGKITDWAQVGGKAGPIDVLARDAKSGTFDTFKTLVLGSGQLSDKAKRFEDSNELSDAVSTDPQAIGFVGLPFVRSAKLLAVSETGAAPLLATRFTVATEDYALARRLFIYTAATPSHPWISRFVEFALGEEGQDVVSKIGFIKQTIDLQRPTIAGGAPTDYLRAAKDAERLSLNLRFRKGSTDLDNKSIRDLDRISQLMGEPRANGRHLMLFGFSDNSGTSASNVKLSRERAQAIGKQLAMRGITPALVSGLGPVLPVASNESEQGRERNRRVEVWLK